MKLITATIFILAAGSAYAQSWITAVRIEQTVQGAGLEGSFAYETRKQFAIGAFYQTKKPLASESVTGTGDKFIGTYLQVPLAISKRILFSGVLRSGIMNEQFFVIAPALETRISVSQHLGIVAGTTYRHGYPAGALAVALKLPASKRL